MHALHHADLSSSYEREFASISFFHSLHENQTVNKRTDVWTLALFFLFCFPKQRIFWQFQRTRNVSRKEGFTFHVFHREEWCNNWRMILRISQNLCGTTEILNKFVRGHGNPNQICAGPWKSYSNLCGATEILNKFVRGHWNSNQICAGPLKS